MAGTGKDMADSHASPIPEAYLASPDAGRVKGPSLSHSQAHWVVRRTCSIGDQALAAADVVASAAHLGSSRLLTKALAKKGSVAGRLARTGLGC